MQYIYSKGRPRKSQTNQTDNTPAKKSKLNLDVEEDKPIAARRTPRTPKKTGSHTIIYKFLFSYF